MISYFERISIPMSDAPDPLSSPPSGPAAPPLREHLEFKAVLLLVFMLVLVLGSAVYVMYARGVFDSTQKLILVAEDSEGVVVGMDLTFSGFPIGRVRRIELADDGKARIVVDVSSKDAHWLRVSSVFTIPDISVVLKVGLAHAGEFGGIEQTQRAKSEIVTQLPADAVVTATWPVPGGGSPRHGQPERRRQIPVAVGAL